MTRKIELSEFKDGLAKKAFTRRDIHKALMAVGVGVLTLPYIRPAAAAPAGINLRIDTPGDRTPQPQGLDEFLWKEHMRMNVHSR